jgi:hypothetical protein
MPSDMNIARGMTRAGSLMSPATAAMRSKPWRAMKVKPIAWTSPSTPKGRNGRRAVETEPTGAPMSAARPPAIRTPKTMILATLIHPPPPPPRQTRSIVKTSVAAAARPPPSSRPSIHSGAGPDAIPQTCSITMVAKAPKPTA